MELKHIVGSVAKFGFLVLIVPYGIETSVLSLLLVNYVVLIVPYGIETQS